MQVCNVFVAQTLCLLLFSKNMSSPLIDSITSSISNTYLCSQSQERGVSLSSAISSARIAHATHVDNLFNNLRI